jgi:protein required for attachment to host cells
LKEKINKGVHIMKKETWVVVANSALARVFRLEGHNLVEMETLVHPEARLSEKDLVTDKRGNAGEGRQGRRSDYSPPHSAKETSNGFFAKKISQHLENERLKGAFSKLYLAAGPDFLGCIRGELSPQIQQLVAAEIDKDITHLKLQEIKNHFPIGI